VKKIILRIALIIFLTILSQTGGLIYMACFPLYKIIDRHFSPGIKKFIIKALTFPSIYLLLTFTLVPFIAKQFGRIQLPVTRSGNLQPLTIFTAVLNRNYVRPALKEVAESTADKMNQMYPGTTVFYLDACFPFINKFPLVPHLSHNDGKKIDLCFFYTDATTHKQVDGAPSPIGYGICEEPLPGEINTAEMCSEKGYWQYSLLRKIIPQKNKKNYVFDETRTKQQITFFTGSDAVEKIFIEPHLALRLKVKSYPKIRFHGCRAVRHDDHLHVQIK
jgi:hypothetical protein